MKKLFHPWGSLLFVTLPQALLAAALFYIYRRTALVPSLPLTIIFGAQALFNLFIIICAAFRIEKKHIRTVQLAGFIAVISAAAPFLLEQFDFGTSLSPEAIYGVLCMIPLVYIATAILHRDEIPRMKVKSKILICVCVPLVFAVVPLFAITGLFGGAFSWAEHVDWLHSAASVILVLLFALFFVFVCLVTSILYHYRTKRAEKKDGEGSENQPTPKQHSPGYYVFIAVLALMLPQLCLLINNEGFGRGILGDFSGAWFYILAAVNGIAMLLPRKNKWVTLAALFFKSAGFLYVFYFVVTMIRYAPLGVAFFAYLLPLLVLTPAALFIAELFQIIDDFRFLQKHFAGLKISAVCACGMLTLCAGFIGNGYIQKVNFDNALCYLGETTGELPPVKAGMLESSLRYVRSAPSFFSRAGEAIPQNLEGPPILNEIYHRLFFAGKTLDDDAYTQMSRIFLPDYAPHWGREAVALAAAETLESVKLQDVKTEGRKTAGVYKTWVHLTLKNETSEFNQEYAVQFTLPEGVYVSDYYLDVYGERKHGLIAEKNVAKSVYSSIVNRSRDPGIICYAGGNTVELRVFPFGAGETRQTGFELMFKQSDSFTLGKHTIRLQGEELAAPVVTGGACFMPASYKANLQTVSARTPKYYFVADTRKPPKYSDGYPPLQELLGYISDYAQKNAIADADVYLTGYNARKTSLRNLDTADPGEGGFNLALAMDMIYRDAKQYPESYPVILVATGDLYNAAVADNRRFTRDYPETECYYLLGGAGAFTPHRYEDNRMEEIASANPQSKRLAYNGFSFRDDGQNELSYNIATGFSDISYGGDMYTDALLLGEKIEKAGTDEQIIETVRDGISRRLLTKNNSFIVLETKQQEEELNRRNQDFLEGKTPGASAASMREPGLLAALLLPALLPVSLWIKRRKRFGIGI